MRVRLITGSSMREGARGWDCWVHVNVLGGSRFKLRSRRQRGWMLSVILGTKTQSGAQRAPYRCIEFTPDAEVFILLTGDN